MQDQSQHKHDDTNAPAVVFNDVRFTYPGQKHPALDGVSLQIAAGEFVAVLGANGSGKSTLAKHMNALLTPQNGYVQTCGLELSKKTNAREARKLCGMVFQNPDNQSVAPVVEDDVAFGPENLGLSSEQIRARVDQALDAVGMTSFAQNQIAQLSGGQKQRVAIAGALAMQPQVLVLDEPSSMLDAAAKADLLQLLHNLNDGGLTVVLITHDANEATHAGSVFVMDAGRIALAGTPAQVFAQPQKLYDLGLDLPFELELQRVLAAGAAGKTSVAARAAGATKRDSTAKSKTEVRHQTMQNLRLEHVSYSYGDDPADAGSATRPLALTDISLQVVPGQILGVVGPMGSGKSTLLQVMAGLMAPSGGRISLESKDTGMQPLSQGRLRELTGLVFQYPEQQLFASTVLDDVAFGPRNRGASKDDARKAAEKALRQCDLDPQVIGERSPFLLSGGQQRRVAIAGILALRPKFLLLDEPCSGLDAHARESLFLLLNDLKALDMGIVLVTHSMEDAAHWCDSLLVLNGGRVLLSGTPEEVFCADNAAALKAIGLDLPWPARYASRHGIPGTPLTIEALAETMR